MPVLDTLPAGCRTRKLVIQVGIYRSLDRSGRARGGINTITLEELNCAPTHSAAEHDISFLLVNKTGDLPRLVTGVKRVSYHLHVFYLGLIQVYQCKIGAAPKVMGNYAF